MRLAPAIGAVGSVLLAIWPIEAPRVSGARATMVSQAATWSRQPEGVGLLLPSVWHGHTADRAVLSLILTDASAEMRLHGLAPDDPEALAWTASLERLAGHPAVSGRLVRDLGAAADPSVEAARNAWAANRDPTQTNRKANAQASAVRDWIWRMRDTRWPQLRYLVIAGDDRVVPFYRLRIDPPPGDLDWATEADYFREGTVSAGSTVGAALAADLSLTDDYYAAPALTEWSSGAHGLPLPAISVGRLVERPLQQTAIVEAFLARPSLEARTSLLAGYDFMQDGLLAVAPALRRAAPEATITLLEGDAWTIGDLRRALFEREPDVFFFAQHSSHYHAETPNNGALLVDEVLGASADVSGMLVVGLACHAGLNVPGTDHPKPLDFPEAWLARGATLVASPGWVYGGDRLDPGRRWQEELIPLFAEHLFASGETTVGEALAAAKRDYLSRQTEETPWHAKTVIGTLLYGLPMSKVHGGTR
jgi:hypothetical protein